MSDYSLFDIVGPVMIGPSSSHTAGAARLGKTAARLVDGDIVEVKMILHGSFAATHKGHGTDKALLAGLMGLSPDDEGIKSAFEIAKKRRLKYSFACEDSGRHHPNTVKFIIKTSPGETHEITGSSTGGGRIIISTVDGLELNFTGERNMLVTRHKDTPGVISHITALLYEYRVNIGNMNVSRNRDDGIAGMYMETDNQLDTELIEKIRQVPGVLEARQLTALYDGGGV